MATRTPQPGNSGSESSQSKGALSNKSLTGTQHECRHQLVHHDAANAATKNMTQDAHMKIIHRTGSSKNTMQHVIWSEFIHIMVKGSQLTVKRSANVHRALRNQFITAHNGKPPWSTKAVVCTVRDIEHHDIVSCGRFTNNFSDKHPW